VKPAADDAVAAAVAELSAARKYRHVVAAVVERIARAALAAGGSPAEAVKRAKRRLHQIHAAFVSERHLAACERLLDGLPDPAGRAAVEAVCARVLRGHASTRERPRDSAPLYRDLFALTGAPRSVLDLGCGLHPFALPWMGIAADAPYHAVDLDLRAVALVGRLLSRLGRPGSATAADLLGDAPLPRADVALLLKLLPTLERQERGGAARLLDRVEARALVLSFPTSSLGRRDKGMARGYADLARRLLDGRGGRVSELSTREELLYVVAPERGAL